MFLILLQALKLRYIVRLKPSPPHLPAERLFVRWDYGSQNPSGAAVSSGEFTSELPCWRPPRRPSASRSEQPAAPPSCLLWPRGAGCPGSRTSPGPRRSQRPREQTDTRTNKKKTQEGKRKVQQKNSSSTGQTEAQASVGKPAGEQK